MDNKLFSQDLINSEINISDNLNRNIKENVTNIENFIQNESNVVEDVHSDNKNDNSEESSVENSKESLKEKVDEVLDEETEKSSSEKTEETVSKKSLNDMPEESSSAKALSDRTEETLTKESLNEKTEESLSKKSLNEKTEESKIGIWEDILGSGSIMKKLLVEGKPDSRPQKSSICTINYKLMLEDETLVEEGKDQEVQLGDLEVVQGVEVVLSTMSEGEKCQILVEPRLAFGSQGLKPSIPPDTKVLYELELIKSESEEEIEFLSFAERKRRGNAKRQRGNWWYSRDECSFAIQCYRRALDYLDEVEGGISNPLPESYDPKEHEVSDAALQDLLEDRLNVCNNMAAAQIKLEAYDAAMQSLQTVLRCHPNNVKALYRKSKILRAKSELTEALKCLNKVKQVEPDNKTVLKEIQELNATMQKQKNYEKELARRMFNSGAPQSEKKPEELKKKRSLKPFLWAVAVGTLAIGVGLVAWRSKF